MRKKNSLVRWTTWKQSWLRFPTELARGQKSLELRFNLKQCDLVTVHKNWPGYFVNWQSSLRIIYIVYNLNHQTEFKSLEGEPTATFIDILSILALYNNNLVCSIWKIYTFNYMIGHISTTQKEPVYLRWTQFFT